MVSLIIRHTFLVLAIALAGSLIAGEGGVSSSALSNGGVELKWTFASQGAQYDGFRIYRAVDSKVRWPEPDAAFVCITPEILPWWQRSYVDRKGLMPGQRYEYRICAVSRINQTLLPGEKAVFELRQRNHYPAEVKLPVAAVPVTEELRASRNGRLLTVQWKIDPAGLVHSRLIEYRVKGGTFWQRLAWPKGTDTSCTKELSATVQGALEIRCTGFSEDMKFSPPSFTVIDIPNADPLLHVSGLRARQEGSRVVLTWDAGNEAYLRSGTLKGYRVYVDDRSVTGETPASPLALAFLVSGLPAGEHTFQVVPEDFLGRVPDGDPERTLLVTQSVPIQKFVGP